MRIFEGAVRIVSGWLEFKGATSPDVSPSGAARIKYDPTADQLQVSLNGAAFAQLQTLGARVDMIHIEDLAAGADIAARAEWAAPAGGATITKIGIVPKGASAGIDNSNTAVVAVADAAANSIVSKTYDTATQPPAASTYADLGTLTNATLTANEVVTVAVTQGATANLPAFLLVVEWTPL